MASIEYHRKYRRENAERIRETKRIWILNNKESVEKSAIEHQLRTPQVKKCVLLKNIDGYRDWQRVVFSTLNKIKRAQDKPEKLKSLNELLKQLRADRANLDFAKYKSWSREIESKEDVKAVTTDKILRLSALKSNTNNVEMQSYFLSKINLINDKFYSQYGERIPYYG